MALLAAEQHTDELEAWLFDEGKVVTARWLSLVLNLPASQARRILCAFYRTHRGKVHATFLVSGQRADGGARELVLLSEDTVASEKDRIFSKVHSLQVYGLHVSQKLGQGDLQLLAGDMALARELADAKSDSGESFRLNKLSAVSCSHITISDKPYQAPLPPPPKPEHTSSSSSSTSRATEGPTGASKNNKSKDNFATFFNRRPATAKDVPEEKAKAKPEEPKDNKDTPNKRSKPGVDGGAKRKGSGDGGDDADVKAATKMKASHITKKEEEEDKEGSPPKRARHDPATEQDEDGEQADKKPEAGKNGDDNDVSSSEDEWEPEHKSAEDKKVDKAAKKKAKAKARAEKKRSNSEDGGEGDDADEEGTKKKSRRKKKSKGSPEDEDAVQIVQEPVSGAMDAFVSSSTAPPTDGPRTTKKLVEKSYVDDRGYLVIENVWEEVEVAAPPPAPAPAPPPPKPSQPSQPASKKSKKETAKDKQNDGRVQKSMLSFFKRK